MRALLEELGLIDPASIKLFYPRVRDRDDVAAYRCARSGIIFLSASNHIQSGYYEDKTALGNLATEEGDQPLPPMLFDARRRANELGHLIQGRRWLDFGTGRADIIDLLGRHCHHAVGVEPNRRQRQAALERGLEVVADINDLAPDVMFDVITLFHVFEHLAQPIEALEKLRLRLVPGGRLILEVPHARDFLLEMADCEPFRRFTLWSEHLLLHTRASLAAFLEKSNFGQIVVQGYQRYPVANHLYWLRNGKPGGHEQWSALDTPALHNAYTQALAAIDQTDSLLAFAQR